MTMRRSLTSLSIATAASLLAASLALAVGSPSPPPEPGASPSASAGTGSTDASAPVGPLAWTRSTKGKRFPGGYAAALAQAGDGTAYLCGSTTDQRAGTKAAVWSSANASKWDPVKLPADPGSMCLGIAAGTSGLVAVGGGDTGHLWTSSNGTKWKDRAPKDTASLNDVELDPAGFLVVGDAGTYPDTAPTLWTSVDGAEWEAHPIAEAGSARHIAVSPEGVLVVAGKLAGAAPGGSGPPVIWRSTDGLTWEETPLAGDFGGEDFIPALETTPFGFVVTFLTRAEDGSGEGSAWVSTDGSSWLKALAVPDGSLSAIGTIGPEALLVGPGGTWRSADGTTWVFTAEDTFEPYDVLAGIIPLADGRWLAGGDTFDQPEPGIATWVGSAAE
jgi:hypothetical protein